MRYLLAALVAVGIALGVQGQRVVADTITPTADDRALFERGVHQQELINLFFDPRGCGIVLMRPYCQMMVADIQDAGAGTPGLVEFARTGNIDLYSDKWSYANVVVFPDADWKNKPRDTWLRDAGAMYAAYYVENWDAYSMMLAISYKQLLQYAPSASPYDSLIAASDKKSPKLDLFAPKRIAKYLAPELGSVFKPLPEPKVVIDDGPLADAALGVYTATGRQMFDSPMTFLAPSSRAFLNELAIRLGDASLGRDFIAASDPAAWKAAVTKFDALELATVKPWPDQRRRAFFFGVMAAQAAYNAAILREKPARDQQLAALQNFSSSVPPEIASKVATLTEAKDDWHALNSAATDLTWAIMHQ